MSSNIDWSAVEPNREAWASLLDQILTLAASALDGSGERRERTIEFLHDYIVHSPLDVLDLADVAQRAAGGLAHPDPNERRDELGAACVELERIRP